MPIVRLGSTSVASSFDSEQIIALPFDITLLEEGISAITGFNIKINYDANVLDFVQDGTKTEIELITTNVPNFDDVGSLSGANKVGWLVDPGSSLSGDDTSKLTTISSYSLENGESGVVRIAGDSEKGITVDDPSGITKGNPLTIGSLLVKIPAGTRDQILNFDLKIDEIIINGMVNGSSVELTTTDVIDSVVTLGDPTPPTIAITTADDTLTTGETAAIAFTLSEAATDFFLEDATVWGGSLSGFTGSGTSYTATFTPTSDSTENGIIAVSAGAFTDAAGNASTTGASVTLNVNTLARPTLTIASDDLTLGIDETARITFTLSEASTDFTVEDVTVSGGSLSNFAGSGTSYTATFIPTASSTENGVVTVTAGAFSNAADNANEEAVSITMTIDTINITPLTAKITSDKSELGIGDIATLAFTLSEISTDFTIEDISISGGDISNFTGSGRSYTAKFTPSAESTIKGEVSIAADRFSNSSSSFNIESNIIELFIDTINHDKEASAYSRFNDIYFDGLLDAVGPESQWVHIPNSGMIRVANMDQLSSDAYLLSGVFTGSHSIGWAPTTGQNIYQSDIFLAAIDSAGNLKWSKQFGSPLRDDDPGMVTPIQIENSTGTIAAISREAHQTNIYIFDAQTGEELTSFSMKSTAENAQPIVNKIKHLQFGYAVEGQGIGDVSISFPWAAEYMWWTDPDYASAIELLSEENLLFTGVTDKNGNWEYLTEINETGMPRTPTVFLPASQDSGSFNNDNITNVRNPIFSGLAEPSSQIEIYANNKLLGSSTTDDSGFWSFQSDDPLEDGKFIVEAAQERQTSKEIRSIPLILRIDTQDLSAEYDSELIASYSKNFYSLSNSFNLNPLPTWPGDPSPLGIMVIKSETDDSQYFDFSGDLWTGTGIKHSQSLPKQEQYQFKIKATDRAGNSSIHNVLIKNPIDQYLINPRTKYEFDLDGDSLINPVSDGIIFAAVAMESTRRSTSSADPREFTQNLNDLDLDEVLNPTGNWTWEESGYIKEKLKHVISLDSTSSLDMNQNNTYELDDAEILLRLSMGTFPGNSLTSALSLSGSSLTEFNTEQPSLDQQLTAIDQASWLN